MKRNLFFGLFLMLFVLAYPAKPVLKFCGKTFKIVQFTDIHWMTGDKNSQKNDSTFRVINEILDKEKPDFVVYTGDVVVSEDAYKGWDECLAPVILRKIPYAVTFGNHDAQHGLSERTIFNYLINKPYNLTTNVGRGVDGYGNCVIPIYSSNMHNSWNLFLFDSHSETHDSILGEYDWIKENQVAWYVRESNHIKAVNKRIVPALAFFHIPLPEFEYVRTRPTTMGHKNEEVCSPIINTGLFYQFWKQKDVKAIFVGHDHENDFVAPLAGIKLCYGRKTGYLSYGKYPKGARIILLKEDGTMDTYIRTLQGISKP